MIRWPALPPKHSLQWRLSLGLTVLVSSLWLAATVASGLFLHGEIGKVLDSALQEVAQRVLPLAYLEVLDRDPDAGEPQPAQRVASVNPHTEYITYIVRDAKGRLLLQSHDAVPEEFPPGLRVGFGEHKGMRIYTESAVQGSLLVTAAEPADYRRAATFRAVSILMLPLIVLLPIVISGVWALLDAALRPVLDWRGEIEARGRGNLTPVGLVALPSEIMPVAEAVNLLIARLRQALEAERSFTGNSAHELRTPIAAALAQTQRLIAELSDETVRQRARSIETALRGLSRLSEKLLQLAKAEGGSLLADEPQDLALVLSYVVEDFRRNPAVAALVRLDLPPSRALLSRLDADAFAILVRNLIENALKHGAPDVPVEVRLGSDGVLSIANAGPVVPAETMSRIGRPFERGSTMANGSGLGLAIAKAIVRGAGGRLELVSPRPGHQDGFEARLYLPATASPIRAGA